MRRRRDRGYFRVAKGTKGFFAGLAGFSDFSEFAEDRVYRSAPADWFVVITDIVSSTKAVADGRYKDVNMVAAASIVAVLNVSGDTEIPFVFGGDGATLLVPPDANPAVGTVLNQLSSFVSDQFHMTLRIGMVRVGELERRGRPVRVARFQLSSGSHSALFAGGGVELAQSLVKDMETADLYSVSGDPVSYEGLDLSGLSCRWEPLPTRNGVILSLLVQTLDPSPEGGRTTYRSVMARVVDILGRDLDAGNPVAEESLRFRWPPRGLGMEVRAVSAGRPSWTLWLRLLWESFLQGGMNRFDLSAGDFDARRYRDELRVNSDYRRFDDTLRLVIDCTPDQVAEIESFLSGLHEDGWLAYGLHRSDAALMTCLVFSLENADHMHFIDGNGGGFTLAARQLKAQLAAAGP